MDTQRAVVVGGGSMGADIAAILAAHGWRVGVVEPDRARWPALAERVAGSARSLGAAGAAIDLAATNAEADWTGVSLVIECAPERLELKRAIFAELERLAPADAILGSNSSSFPISAIAAGLATARRMVGLHFFLPAHLVPAVEVIRGAATDEAVWHRAAELMRACGKVPVMVRKDIPGFLANRIQHALMREAFALIDAGLATPEDIDNAVRYGFGFRYVAAGPILQKELAGLDIHAAAAATMYPDLACNKEPGATLTGLVAAGKLGLKTGEGFWKWTPASARAARERYERDLADALRILERSLDRG
ncbi:MAG: 3-hydroxyacyl-CoA dehydrogenase NAD-binding domain-containing protein [Burkholderiales bacterium]|nr:3-hydroxyacyl-CoA dehydrogenase NAD-binding domain-containing protein [Burkholderiales bacterium]